MKYTRLGDLLVDAGLIDQDKLSAALSSQKESHRRLGEELIATGVITERQLIDALRMQLGIDYIDLTNVDIDPEMTSLVPKRLAKKYSVVPVRSLGEDLWLAMVDPLNFIAVEEIRTASKKKVIPMIATQSGVDRAIAALYGTEGAKRAIREMQQESVGEEEIFSLAQEAGALSDSEGQSAPSIRLVDSIIERGIADHASDVHIEPQQEDMIVRMRIDGILHHTLTIPKELQQSVTSRFKVMSGMDVTERRVPQDGRALVRIRDREIDLRVSTLPTVDGEKIVLRILDRSDQEMTPEGLGFSGLNLDLYNKLMSNTQGMILIVGPTGSGKSSTMFAMVEQLNTEAVNLITLEDPVEYNIQGVNQVQINEKTGTTFASGLRSILRQDPDIVCVGEIRDGETASIAMRAAVTGHLVLSTIHTGNAVSTLDRLHDIGVEPYMVSTALHGVISQRLVRRICPHCRKPYTPDTEELEMMGMDPQAKDVTFYKGQGCSECYNTGYRGRIATLEILVINKAIRQAIHSGAPHDVLMRAVEESGFVPMMENARQLVLDGVTTSSEAFRTLAAED